jgi:diguanylate cyclase (GGDEF)-like protein
LRQEEAAQVAMATEYQHGWVRAAEQLDGSARRTRRLVVGGQAATSALFAVGGLTGLPAPAGWQLLLLAAAAAWSAYVTDVLAGGRRPVEHCCMAQLPTALVVLVAGVAGPRGSAAAALAVLVLLVLAAAPYVERSHLGVLLAAGGAAALAVEVAAEPGRFPVGWFGVLAVVAVGVGLVRQARGHAEVLRDLMTLEATDALTGLPNAHYLHQAVEEGFAAATPQQPLALVTLEIDGYRDLDHAHGFRVADPVLARVAARLRTALPPGAVLARGDGDVLVAVLPGTDAALAWDVAAALRSAATHRPAGPHGEPDPLPAVRITAGIAVHPCPDVLLVPAVSGQALVRRAETALHDARRRGEAVRIASAVDAPDAEEVARPAYV